MRQTQVLLEIMRGATRGEASAELGHRTAQMTQRYAHLTEQHQSALVRKMAARVMPGQTA